MERKGFWNRLKAEWYRRGLDYSTFSGPIVSIMLKKAPLARTFLDVGCGCGTLAIPLAKKGKRVTALDPSPHMLKILKRDIKRLGIKNIKPVNKAWAEVKLKPHDVIVCANVPELLKDSIGFLKETNALAKIAVFLVAGADPLADKFYYKELFPLIFNKPFLPRSDYLATYANIHSLGIFANVEIIDYAFDQPFKDMEEAMEFWKEYMGLVTDEHDEKLRGFLEKKLVRVKNGLLAKFRKKSAIIWWRK